MEIGTWLPALILLNVVAVQRFAGVDCVRHYSKEKILSLREDVRGMFQHAYEGYLRHAADYDELRPLTCDGVDTWGSYSLTLIDSLSTLATMGNFSEFRRVAKLLETKMDFDKDINVSVFETNIRIVGGLLAAHLMSERAGIAVEEGWPCVGPLLRLAEDMAKRLLPAFETATGMPYGTVNLRYGVPKGETAVTCTATVGTFLVEFGTLSRLTGNSIYEEVALNAVYSLWERRSPLGMFGNHIDVQTGRWTALDAGIGAGVDSFFEYLVKGAILLNRPDLLQMFHEARASIDKYMKRDDWYVWVGMNKGQVTLPVFQSLEAFWPGVLSTIGDTGPAIRTIAKYYSVWRKYGFLPEFYNIPAGEATPNRESYPLRPELAESAMYLYRATGNQFLLEVGEDMLQSIQFSARTKCGFSTIRNVVTHEKENRMESFFLSETTKYLYLLFDEENFLHNDGTHGDILETPHGQCVVNAGAYIFNTEAHPVDMSALWCCHGIHVDIFDGLDLEQFGDDALLKASRTKRLADEQASQKYQCSDTVSAQQDKPNLGKHNDSGLTVDIEVFDENNNPASEVLVQNFEHIRKNHSQPQDASKEAAAVAQEQLSARNQLTVQDLEEHFSVRRAKFESAQQVLNYTVSFMQNFTLDAAYIRGLQLFDASVTTVLGGVVQKEYEAETRSLWELYALQQQYAVNAELLMRLDVLNFEQESGVLLASILRALGKDEATQRAPAEHDDDQEAAIEQKIQAARLKYELALVNVTAMQQFLHNILVNGTTEKKRNFVVLLSGEEIAALHARAADEPEHQRKIFTHARRIVKVRQAMVETFAKLQTFIADGNKVDKAATGQTSEDDGQTGKAVIEGDLIVAAKEKARQKEATARDQSAAKTTGAQVESAAKDKKPQEALQAKHVEENAGSIWSQLVETILRKTTSQRKKFDEQALLERTRVSLQKYASIPKNFELFTCQQPKFIEKFAYRDQYP